MQWASTKTRVGLSRLAAYDYLRLSQRGVDPSLAWCFGDGCIPISEVYLKLTVIDDVLIVSFKEL
ncbi:MAG: hypothetical protein ACYDDA_15390 [Acidiferrobacteraceae bacterium]